jgi:hypothetical protein
MAARVFESESSTDMALLIQLGEPANTGLAVVDRGHSHVCNQITQTQADRERCRA